MEFFSHKIFIQIRPEGFPIWEICLLIYISFIVLRKTYKKIDFKEGSKSYNSGYKLGISVRIIAILYSIIGILFNWPFAQGILFFIWLIETHSSFKIYIQGFKNGLVSDRKNKIFIGYVTGVIFIGITHGIPLYLILTKTL